MHAYMTLCMIIIYTQWSIRSAVVNVLIWNTAVDQECSGYCSNLEHSGQSEVQWPMFYSGTQWSIGSAVVNVLIWNTAVKQECSG